MRRPGAVLGSDREGSQGVVAGEGSDGFALGSGESAARLREWPQEGELATPSSSNKLAVHTIMKIVSVLVLAALVHVVDLAAQDSSAQWSSPTTATLSGTTATASTDGGNPPGIENYDLSGSDFSFAPLAAVEQTLDYSQNSNISLTFARPVPGLKLYLVFWRTGTYTLNRSFVIRSGTNFTQSGNQITVAGGFGSGIIEFTDTFSSLTILSSAFGSGAFSRQSLQLAAPVLDPPILTLRGKRTIRTSQSSVTIRGKAAGGAEINRVEFRAPGKAFRKAKGTSSWSFRFRPDRRSSRLTIRAVDELTRTSRPVKVKVIQTEG
jgi:hypothetical protein